MTLIYSGKKTLQTITSNIFYTVFKSDDEKDLKTDAVYFIKSL